ncbi:MAG: hypothetical protein OIF50_16335 [Flavobacteriaceae bacterium]|nr:hypothetical protein [Flavobacteriaceae bacterium]
MAFFEKIVANAPPFIRELSLKELSLLGSTQYSNDFRIGRNLFAKGALFAAELDAYLQAQSDGKQNLQTLILQMMEWTKTHPNGFGNDQFPALVQLLTGYDISAIWVRY